MRYSALILALALGIAAEGPVTPAAAQTPSQTSGDWVVPRTTNLHPLQQYKSESMKVTERFSRVAEDALLYEFRIDDPTTYTEPWGGQVPMKALDDSLYEYACHEGNYSMSNVLSGARYQDRVEADVSRN